MTAQTILPANSATGAFEVTNSLRFNGSNSSLSRTVANAAVTNAAFSCWFKRTTIGANQTIYSTQAGNEEVRIKIHSDDKLDVYHHDGSNYVYRMFTNRLFRDPSAWYHLVIRVDTTNGTADNRIRIYINGTQETSFSARSNPDQNSNIEWFQGATGYIGMSEDGSSNPFGGYLAEVVMVDGSTTEHTVFGEFDEDTTTVWKPKAVYGAVGFGTNGWYLNFKDSSSLGNSTGNSNDFTANNLAAKDQSIDTCQNNFCTLNPLQIGPRNNQSESAGTFSEGALNVLGTGTADDFAGTIAVSTGKWFYEVKLLTALNHGAGFAPLEDFTSNDSSISNGIINGAQQYGSNEGGSDSRIANNGNTDVSPQNNFDDDDIISFAFDIDGGTLKIYNNGSLDRTISSIPADTYIPIGGDSSSTDASLSFNFGSPSYSESGGNSDGSGYGNFSMAVPSGYFSICTKNLAEYG